MKKAIDINADIGEGYGRYTIGNDEEIIKYITSANVACGFHAGDPQVIRNTIKLAKKYGVKVGAHPSYPDLQGFGRRSIKFQKEELINFIIYQLGAISGFLKVEGLSLSHVKPHGALYNDAVKNKEVSEAIGEAILLFDKNLPIIGLAGSLSIKIWREMGLKIREEVFADRNYKEDGTLVSRREKNAVIHNLEIILERVYNMVTKKEVKTIEGKIIPISFDTICIHGDTKNAPLIAKKIKEKLFR